MPSRLVPIDKHDLEKFHNFQQQAFRGLSEKYHDEHSLYLESRECIAEKFQHDSDVFYWICKGQEKLACIRLVLDQEAKNIWLGIVFLLLNYQGLGYARQAVRLAEKLYTDSHY